MNRYTWILVTQLLLAPSAQGAESVARISYKAFNHHLGEGDSECPGVCIVPEPIWVCSASGRAAVAEITASGSVPKYCGTRDMLQNDQYNPLRELGLQVHLKDEISDAEYPGYDYRKKPYTIEVSVTSTSKLLMMDSKELRDYEGYSSGDELIAAAFYCSLLATAPETSNAVTLRVVRPSENIPCLGSWNELKVHWDAKQQAVQEGSIMGYVLHRSLGVWYCCTEAEAKELRDRE